MKASDKAKALIERFEGRWHKSYLCPANVWTIGVGHTAGVKRGMEWTDDQIDAALDKDLEHYAFHVNKMVMVSITQSQFDALVSFAFNVGINALRKSTLLRLLNNGQALAAAEEFLKWDKATVNGKKKALPGLTIRREMERALFLEA